MSESSHRMVARPMNWISASPQHRETEDVSLRLRQTAIVRHHEHTKASHDRIPNKSSRSNDDDAQDSAIPRIGAMTNLADAVVGRFSASPVGDVDGLRSAATTTPNGIRSSPPTVIHEIAMDADPPNGSLEDVGPKSDSEAETIVLPGKDGHSPSKIRKSIKHEDKSEDEEMGDAPEVGTRLENDVKEFEGGKSSETNIATSLLGKRKRPKHGSNGNGLNKDDSTHHGNSSGLSSVPTSPVATNRSSLSKRAASDSDISRSPSPRDKAKSVDRVLPRRKQYRSGSGDEEDINRFSRQRSSGADQKQRKDTQVSRNNKLDSQKRARSISPPVRGHRRSISNQLPERSSHGLSHKKKRVPAPLQSTEYQSDESSASGSSHPRSSRLRHLAAPTTGDSAISPAKMAPHKKHVNSSGQTRLAQACQNGKLEVVKQRYEDRPGDVDEPDHAQNTPLHTASINGHAEVVKFLLEARCAVDPINLASDTPLHDAIENGHLEVVKLLLDAGANPRKANGAGETPIDLVNESMDDAIEIREAIVAACQKFNDTRRSSEDNQMQDITESRLSQPKGSPRQTPPVQAHNSITQGSTSRRNATTRSIKTSDSLLYQNFDVRELRRAAGENDMNTVVQILNVLNNLNDAKSLVIAAKAGHHDVVNILFGMGEFDPDPSPLQDEKPENATPILAAIGRESLEVIKYILNQPKFDPTRLVDGETYFHIAKRRAGTNWKDEVALLKDAYETHNKKSKSSPAKPRSPGLRRNGRETDPDTKRIRKDEHASSRLHQRTTSNSRTKEAEAGNDQNSSKRGPGRPRKDDNANSTSISDDEATPLGPPKQKAQARRSESEVALASSENETAVKPRRKLVSGKEFRGERELERQRRTSIASTTSSASIKERRDGESRSDKLVGRTSPSVQRISSKNSGHNDNELTSDKSAPIKDMARSRQRDDSKDRLSVIRGESPVKRPRKSETPPRSAMHESGAGYEGSGGPQKRRKLENDSRSGTKAESTSSSSPDHRINTAKSSLSHEKSVANLTSEAKEKDRSVRSDHRRVDSPERSRHSQSGGDHPKKTISAMATMDLPKASDPNSHGAIGDSAKESTSLALKVAEEREAQKAREKEEQEARIRHEKEEQEAKEKAELEEKRERERIEQAKKARLAREQAAREEESKRLQEEKERRERQRQEDAEAHARDQERKRIQYEEQENKRREEQERRRAHLQEQQRAERLRIEEAKKQERLAKLPLLLRWLDLVDDPKTPEIASLFKYVEGFRYDTIKPEATGQPNGRDQWMLNTHVALLLGEKDLQLSRYTAWERIPLSRAAKLAIWGFSNGTYSLHSPNFAALLKLFPANGESRHTRIEKCKPLFLDLDLFFVKVSEFMFVVPNFPHLRDVEIQVNYRELIESPIDQASVCKPKFKKDPNFDPNIPFKPQPCIYINGEFIRQREVPRTRTSDKPFPEKKVPRRGLVQVLPDDPDYLSLVREQGLYHLLPETQTAAGQQPEQISGITPPSSDKSKSINGGSPHPNPISDHAGPTQNSLPNGIHRNDDIPGSK